MENKNAVLTFLGKTAGKWTITLACTVVVFILIALTAKYELVYIMLAYGLVGAYFGWKALNKITPKIFIWMPIVGWVIYYIVKFFLSVFVGYFITPYQIGKMVSSYVSEHYGK